MLATTCFCGVDVSYLVLLITQSQSCCVIIRDQISLELGCIFSLLSLLVALTQYTRLTTALSYLFKI